MPIIANCFTLGPGPLHFAGGIVADIHNNIGLLFLEAYHFHQYVLHGHTLAVACFLVSLPNVLLLEQPLHTLALDLLQSQHLEEEQGQIVGEGVVAGLGTLVDHLQLRCRPGQEAQKQAHHLLAHHQVQEGRPEEDIGVGRLPEVVPVGPEAHHIGLSLAVPSLVGLHLVEIGVVGLGALGLLPQLVLRASGVDAIFVQNYSAKIAH